MAQFLGAGYHFKRIRILKDQELGCGSYGMVCKALCDELLCAAKLLHPVLVSERNVQKFHQECQILSGLKHPNIIQYLGTHNNGPTSCLLMELMEESLTSFLERSTPPLPFHTEVNLCHDISLALAYLHSNDIIHRDLSSNNVLLTADKRAKVTDFGMSRLADTSAHLLSTLTQAPGCYVYMSPEALAHTPKYSKELDIFSMGVLIVQILTCKFPSPSSPRKKVVDKRYPRPVEIPVIETERRKAHIDLVDPTHPLLKHACACLSDEDEDRPNAQEMCQHMLELEKNEHYLKAKSDSKVSLEQLQCQLKRKTEELAQRDVVISKMREDLIKVNEDISQKKKIISEKDELFQRSVEQLQCQLKKKTEELAQRDVVISRMREDLIKVNEDFSRKNKIISENDKEIVKKDELLQRRDEELAQKEQYHETSEPTETEFSGSSSNLLLSSESYEAIELHAYNETLEPNVFCIASDETGARTTLHFVTLPHSSCVSYLYSAVAKDAGYKEGSFELYWCRQEKEEEILEWKSSATLHEINMPTEPIKVKAFVRQKEDGSLPVRVSTVVQETLQESMFGSNASSTFNGTSRCGSSGNSILEAMLRKQRQQQLDLKTIFNQSAVSWEEGAVMDSHIWYQVDMREACIFNEETVCLDTKVPKRQLVKCSACNLVVHVNCFRHISNCAHMHCKETFREIKQKVKYITVQHHFLLRHKASGKCKLCDKGYKKSAMLYTAGRELVAYGCSWCGDSYHTTCFKEALRLTPCLLGPHRHSIIPPSWIVRTPAVDNTQGQAKGSEPSTPASDHIASSDLSQVSNSTLLSTTRTRTGGFVMRRKKSSRKKSVQDEERASKYFIVRPYVQDDIQPLLVFVNPKSGGSQGVKVMQTFQSLLNPRQVFDLTKGGPLFGLKMFIHVPNLRILVCGGDGTVGWVLSALDEIMDRTATPLGENTRVRPPVAVLPLGTGNDLARVLGWGGGYSDEPLERILFHIETGTVVNLDRWMLTVFPVPNEGASRTPVEPGAVSDIPLHVINNYFSIGADASVALELHLGRETNPEKTNSWLKNKFLYTRNIMQRKFANLTDSIELEGDGIDLTEQIHDLKLESILFLNIPSYASGTNLWGSPSGRDAHGPQQFDDGMIEIIGLSALTQAGLGRGERIAQCVHIKLHTKKCIPVQIDGEVWKLCPSVIEIIHKNKVPMVMRNHQVTHTFQTPLKGIPSDYTIKLSVSAVAMEAYIRLKCNLKALSCEAIELGYVETTPNDTLYSLRPKIEQLFAKQSASSSNSKPGEKDWRFLDVVMSDGREEDRLYQVMTDSETLVGDMPLDGIFVLDTSDTGTEGADLMKQTDTKGADLMKQTDTKGADLMKQTDTKGADLMKQTDTKGADLMKQIGTKEADLMKQTDTKGADLMKQTDTKGADLMKQTGTEGADLMKQDSYTQLVFSMQDHSVPHSLSSTVPKVDNDGLQKALFDAVKRGPLELGDVASDKPNINTELIEYLQVQKERQLDCNKDEITVYV